MRTPPANPDLQSPPSNPAQGTGPGHVNRGGSDNRDRGAKAGVTHHCGVVKEHAATAGEEPSLKKPPETVRRNFDFAIPQLRSARPVRESNSLKPFGTSNTQRTGLTTHENALRRIVICSSVRGGASETIISIHSSVVMLPPNWESTPNLEREHLTRMKPEPAHAP